MMGPRSDELPMLRPDLPGFVHGIVSVDPPTVQCDGCGWTYSHARMALAVILSGIRFNPRLGDDRRLCRTCANTEGWEER